MDLIDYHCHTILSPDGHVPLNDMIRGMKAAGVRELCVTDHCDLFTGNGTPVVHYDWTPSLAQYHSAQRQGLTVKLGIELGSAPANPQAARAILRQSELDFVLGSLHNWSAAAGGSDYYYTKYTDSAICTRVLEDYFGLMEQLVTMPDCYDSLAHLIYPLRYMTRDGHPMSLAPYEERVRAILTQVARTGHALEVNTYVGKTVLDWAEILRWYKDCGGEYLTVGSDAHHTENAGKGIAQAMELIRAAGFRTLTTYEKRQPKQTVYLQ